MQVERDCLEVRYWSQLSMGVMVEATVATGEVTVVVTEETLEEMVEGTGDHWNYKFRLILP